MTSPARDPRNSREPLLAYLRVQKEMDREMYRLLNAAAKDGDAAVKRLLKADGIGAQIRAAQITLATRELRQHQRTLWRRIANLLREYLYRGAYAAVEAENLLERVLWNATPRGSTIAPLLLRSQMETAKVGIDSYLSRRAGASHPLAASVYRNQALYSGQVDELVNKRLATGASAREIARDVRRFISPDVRGGVSYAAMRLGRTELNNAFHATQIRTSKDKPWVKGYVWHLSGSHGKPDICNEFANDDHSGLGPGVFAVDDVPGKPHPNCLCYLTSRTVRDDEFLDVLQSGGYDDYLNAHLTGR